MTDELPGLTGLAGERILHVGPSTLSVLSQHGGAVQRRILALAQVQGAAGAEVVVASPGPADRVLRWGDATVVEVAVRLRRPARDYEFLLRTRRLLRQRPRFDVVHAHGSPQAAGLLGGLGRTTAHTVDFFRYRGSGPALGRDLYRRALGRADVTMAVSDFCARELAAYYPDLATRLVTVPNGVDSAQFRPDAAAADLARRALGLPASGPLVVYLGRVCHQKGSDLLGELAAALRASHPDATVVAVGPAGQFGVTDGDGLTRDLVDRGVVWTGAVDESLVAGALAMADLVVLPTRHDEMFGMAALEALACGTPVVASDCGGLAEAVGPGGLLVPTGDAGAFVAAVRRLLDDDDHRVALARAGLAHAAGFAWPVIAARTAAAYAAGRGSAYAVGRSRAGEVLT